MIKYVEYFLGVSSPFFKLFNFQRQQFSQFIVDFLCKKQFKLQLRLEPHYHCKLNKPLLCFQVSIFWFQLSYLHEKQNGPCEDWGCNVRKLSMNDISPKYQALLLFSSSIYITKVFSYIKGKWWQQYWCFLIK